MKKTLFFAIAIGTASLFQSCDKLKNEVAKQVDPFNFTQQTIELTIPPTDKGGVASSGIDTVDINLDQIIKDNTPKDLNLGINNIKSLTLEKITLTVYDHNSTNNLSNFEKVDAYINSNTGLQAKKNDIHATAWTNDVYNSNDQSLVIKGDPKMELLDYLKGNKVYYWFKATMRRATTKDLRVKMVIDYKLEPKL